MTDEKTKKNFSISTARRPYGTIYALESLEVVLIGAAFEQDVSLAFIDDGVFQLMAGQDATAAGMKNFSKIYQALGDYEVRKLYVERESLDDRGLTVGDLMPITYEDEDENYEEKPSIHVIDKAAMAQLIAENDVVLSF